MRKQSINDTHNPTDVLTYGWNTLACRDISRLRVQNLTATFARTLQNCLFIYFCWLFCSPLSIFSKMACLKLVTILFACVIIVPITLTSPSLSMKYYRRYNFETGNCSSGTPTKDKQDCLRQCSTSSDCIAFKYSTSIGTCIRCFENEVSSITFGGSSLYLLRGASVFQRFSDVETYIYGTIRFLVSLMF